MDDEFKKLGRVNSKKPNIFRTNKVKTKLIIIKNIGC